MKRMINSIRPFKALLLAGLLAGPVLTYNSMATPRTDDAWSPFNVFTDVHGNQAAAWDDPANWGLNVVPLLIDTNVNPTAFYNAAFNGSTVTCAVTNQTQITQVGQLMVGLGGSGLIEIYPGCQFTAGYNGIGDDWTGIGYVNGPGLMTIDAGAQVSVHSHLWVGQGTATQTGTVVVNGGTLYVPNGEFGLGWNGGTNYCYCTNGGSIYLRDWAAQTLGAPQNAAGYGILDIGANSKVVITNNALTVSFGTTNALNYVIADGQLQAFEGHGTIQAIYNPSANITVLTALAPAGPTTPVFSINPSNSIVGLGGTATLTASASPATGYQWMYNSAPVANGNGISGATTATLTIANFSAAETGVYSVVATNAAASVNDRGYTTSTSATLSADSFNLYPVVTINGVNGSTYVSQYASSLSGPWTSFSTNTAGAGPIQVVDLTSPQSNQKRFYRVTQP